MMKRVLALLLALALLLPCLSLAEDTGYSDAVPQDFSTLKSGDKSDDVKNLQSKLKEIGYLEKVTGVYDDATQEAVLSVQKNYGLDETGMADAETQEVIYSNCYLPLKMGDANSQTKDLQKRLKDLSLYSDQVNGSFGATTAQAVQIFQKLYGLDVTGEADVETLTTLYSDLSSAVVLPAGTATPAPGTITVDEKDIVPFKKKLAYGSTGANVQKVQERLMALGFFTYKKTTTGYYKNTQAAVKQFQEYNGLTVTGTVDEKTWNALFNSSDAVPVSATPRPTPEPTPVPYYMDVDVKNQVTKVFTYDENKDYTVLVRVMICSTGTTSYPSDVGTWTLSGRTARWCTFPKWGGGTAQYWTKINSNIAFHSVIYANYDASKMNESSFNHLGKRASHGCIRLTTQDAKWVYENCGAGTQVYIHNDGNTDAEAVAFAKFRKTNTSVMLPDTSLYDPLATPPAYRRMKTGSQGDDVMWLQMTLKNLGYFTGTVTGYYASMTVSAVKKFQNANKLSVDGVLGEKTYNKLYETQLATPSPTPTATPTASPSPTPTATPGTEETGA